MKNNLYTSYPQITPQLKVKPEEAGEVTKSGIKGILRGLFYKNKTIDSIPYFGTGGKLYPALALIPIYGLCNYNYYLKTKDKVYKEKFLYIIDWLEKNFVDKGDYGCWETTYSMKGRGYICIPPFVSSLVQGQAISALSRAYVMTKNNRYLKIIEKTLNIYEIKISDGGILEIDKNGDYWYEEYPCTRRPTHVLNGFISSLIGPYDYYMVTENKKAKVIFDRGIRTLKNHLQQYELNWGFLKWTRYDNYKMFYASKEYHTMHIDQLKYLYEITDDAIFLKYYNKWLNYQKIYSPIINVIDFPMAALFKIMKIIGI